MGIVYWGSVASAKYQKPRFCGKSYRVEGWHAERGLVAEHFKVTICKLAIWGLKKSLVLILICQIQVWKNPPEADGWVRARLSLRVTESERSEVYLRSEAGEDVSLHVHTCAVHDYDKRPTNHQLFEVLSSPSSHQVRWPVFVWLFSTVCIWGAKRSI